MQRNSGAGWRWLVGAMLLLLFTSATAMADVDGGYHGIGMMWDGSWSGLLTGPVTMLLLIAAVVVLIVILVRWLGGQGSIGGSRPHNAEKTALDIVKERYARGEIDRYEFEERKRLLES